MTSQEPWATVRLNIQFPGDENTYVTAVPVYEGESLPVAIDEAKLRVVSSMLRDLAAWRTN